MNVALLGSVAVAALAASLHCVGMCGPFAALAAGGARAQEGRRDWAGILVFQLGRLFAYALLGAAAGAIGSGVELAGRTAGLLETASIVAGAALVLLGVVALLRAVGVDFGIARRPVADATLERPGFFARMGRAFSSRLARAHGFVATRRPVARGLLLGVLTALLPCGLLWAFLVTAAGTASALSGLAVMAVFWAGTVPALVGVGLLARWLVGRLRRRWALVSPVVLVAMGLALLVWRVQVPVSPEAAAKAAELSGATLAAPKKTRCH